MLQKAIFTYCTSYEIDSFVHLWDFLNKRSFFHLNVENLALCGVLKSGISMCMYVCMHACMNVYVYVYVYVHVCMYECTVCFFHEYIINAYPQTYTPTMLCTCRI